jgi:glutamine amidotransferase
MKIKIKIKNVITAVSLLSVCLLFHGHVRACELLGLSLNEDVSTHHIFSAFRYGGEKNPDGWGMAFYSDRSATLFKEPASATESDLAEFLASYQLLKGKLLIAHVRRATVGRQTHKNTHPFVRELGGREYALAHNGTLEEFQSKLDLSGFTPVGTSDSEYLLCYLLGRIETEGVTEWNEQSFEWLLGELHTINDTGSLNCVFSDGAHLFAYHDRDGYNTLYHLRRTAPYNEVRFNGMAKRFDLGSVYPESLTGVVVATRPLTDEEWDGFTPGELLVFKDGTQVFP